MLAYIMNHGSRISADIACYGGFGVVLFSIAVCAVRGILREREQAFFRHDRKGNLLVRRPDGSRISLNFGDIKSIDAAQLAEAHQLILARTPDFGWEPGKTAPSREEAVV
jgi:hypothetical protein